jgi:membrane protein DedA with SNARE-associated domain
MHAIEMITAPEAYLLLFLWVFAEQIGLPLPAAPALLSAGAIAARGRLHLVPLIAVALTASVLADFMWYSAGSSGSAAANRFLLRHPESRVLQSAKHLFARYGSRSLVFAKFVPGLSLAAPPFSGLLAIAVPQFLLFDGLGSLVWAGSFIGIGYLLGR